MDFTFSEEQRMMAGALRTLTDDICAGAQLRRIFDGSDSAARERWQRLAEMELFGVFAPQELGGLGLSDADFVLLAEEVGRAALPEPLIEQAAVAVPALCELADTPALTALARSAVRGESRIAVLHPQCELANVPPDATHWLLCEGAAVRVFAAAEVSPRAQRSIDAGRRLYALEVPASAAGIIAQGERARMITARAGNRGALYAAAQCLGLAERMLALAVDYAKERVQFGRPIGSYQAIKHQLANVAVKLEFARPVVYAAAARVTGFDAPSCAAVSHAKLAAGDAADLAARTAIQVHGAMGYSWELDLHFFMKRAWALQGAWGDRNFHARRVQSLVCDGALALGPEETFA
jgi:alkylation response protein AidB-like acyl-CoA dehydrogenase